MDLFSLSRRIPQELNPSDVGCESLEENCYKFGMSDVATVVSSLGIMASDVGNFSRDELLEVLLETIKDEPRRMLYKGRLSFILE